MPNITLKAQLLPSGLARLREAEYRFCPAPTCSVVYFGAGLIFRKQDVVSPVFAKEPEGRRVVCHCFGISEHEIVGEIQATGTSRSADRIAALVHAGRCACELRNPQGFCCLGDVIRVVRMARATVAVRR